MENGGKYHVSTIQRRFGTWANAILLCNKQPTRKIAKRRYNSVSKEELIVDLKLVAMKKGVDSITTTEYEESGKYNHNSFKNHFGSWNNALEAA